MKINKIVLSLAGAMAAVAFAPEASAIPAFARQVGMACSACHYQHFPALNSFGRSFKEAGYTMVGAQDKIEGDDISLPSTLNAALVGYIAYNKTNGPAAGSPATTNTTKTTNDGQFQVPNQVSLFFGGRGGEHFGFEAEINLQGTAAGNGAGTGQGNAGLIRFKVPYVIDVGIVKAQIIPFSTANGVADSFEVLNTGAVNVHVPNQNAMNVFSAQQYIPTGTSAHGVAFVASNDDFFANFAKWGVGNGDGTSSPSANYIRGAWTTGLIPGFDSAIGFQNWNGSTADAALIPATSVNGIVDTKAWAIDAQMLGDVNNMPLTLVASYARAAAQGSNPNPNLFNPGLGGQLAMSSFNVGAELGLIPNKATVQLAFRRAQSGNDLGLAGGGAATSTNASDNAILIGATYAVALNSRFEFTYQKFSGDMYSAPVAAAQGAGYLGDSMYTIVWALGL